MGKDAIFSGERRCFCYSSCYSSPLTQVCPILTHCSGSQIYLCPYFSLFPLASSSSSLHHHHGRALATSGKLCRSLAPLPSWGSDTRQTTLCGLTVPLLGVKVQREIYTHTSTGVSTGIQVWLGQVTGSRRKGLTQMGPPATVTWPQAGHPSWHGSQGLWRGAGTVL